MIGVIAFLSFREDATYNEIKYGKRYLTDVARVFDADIVLVDPDEWAPGQRNVVSTIEEALDMFPGFKRVFLVIEGDNHLATFAHPEGDVVYIAGPDQYYLEPDVGGDFIELSLGRGMLWANQALAITLWDRTVKDGSWQSL